MKSSLERVITHNEAKTTGRRDGDRDIGEDVTALYYTMRYETEREIKKRNSLEMKR